VTSVEGAVVVVDAGDLLARWSNGRVRGAKHRVVVPRVGEVGEVAGGGVDPARYSVACL